MKTLLALTLSLFTQISMACVPQPGSFVPNTSVSVTKNQILSKDGTFKNIKGINIMHGRIMNTDMATPAMTIQFSPNEEPSLLRIVSKDVYGCNIEKYTAVSESTDGSLENDLVIEYFDYSNATCARSMGNIGITVSKYGYGLGKLSGWGNSQIVYTIQNCM
jgi:Cu/Ag efflux protein CusF